MAQYENLKTAIADVIKQNGIGYITGDRLQTQLFGIINNLGKYATFAGVVQPNGSPVAHDGPTFYLTGKPGTYANFGGAVVKGISALSNQSGAWVATRILDTDIFAKHGYDSSPKTLKEVDDSLVQLAGDLSDIDILLDKTKTPIVNYIKNGDFSDGTNGWTAPNATVENNVLKYSGTTSPINAGTSTSLETYEGQELIVSFKVKSNIPIPLRMYLRGGSDDIVIVQDTVGEKTSINYLGVIKRKTGSSGSLSFLLQAYAFSGTEEVEIELSDVMILDYSELKKSYSLAYLYSLVNKIGYWEDSIGNGLLLEDLHDKVINDNLLLEKKTGVPIYNEIINGNFTDGSLNWSSLSASIEITDGGAIISSKLTSVNIIQGLNVKPVPGKKIFISFDIKTSDVFSYMHIRPSDSSGNFMVEDFSNDIVLGETVRITKILTLGESFTGDSLQFQIQGGGVAEIYKSFTIDNVVLIDLDKTEGTPQTLSELNRFVDMADGHWEGLYKVGVLTLDNYIKINSLPKSLASNKYVTQRYSHTIPVPHTSDRINYTGVWKDNVRGTAVNGTNVSSSTKGDAISLDFIGDFIGVLLEHSLYGGKAEVFIDGNSQGIVDTYTDAVNPNYAPYVSFKKKIPMGEHNIRIEILGEKNEESLSNNVYFDHFFYNIEKQESVIPQKSGVIFTVDDTRPTTLDYIVPKLAEYGWRGTSYINPGVAMNGSSSWKTYFLKAHDWEVASHTWVHVNLTTIPIEEARYNIRMAAEWLQANGMDCGHFAPPGNSTNADVMKIVKEFHCSRVGGGNIHFDPNDFDVYAIPRYDVTELVDLEDLKQKLREVKEMDRTIALYFHGVVDQETTVPPSITLTLFNEIVDYMAEIELDVFRMKDFLPLG